MKRLKLTTAILVVAFLLSAVYPHALASAPTKSPPGFFESLREQVAKNPGMAERATTQSAPWVVVASGLDNPRGLSVDKHGAIYVAEAGRGGDVLIQVPFEGEIVDAYAGDTGAITKIWDGRQQRVVTGLPSYGTDDTGVAIAGVHDVDWRTPQDAYAVIGLGGPPWLQDYLGREFGTLIRIHRNRWTPVANLARFEETANPDLAEADSNPNAVLARGEGQIVVDAGGNDLLQVIDRRRIQTLAVFPFDRFFEPPPDWGLPPGTMLPIQPVPDSVVQGPDRAYYVGELTGFPYPAGQARVYRVVPGSAPEVFLDGFTNIIDLAFDRRDNLYVLEITTFGLESGDPTGALYRVAPDGTRTLVAREGLVFPTGLTIGLDGAAYVSNYGIFPGMGEVIRIEP